MQSRIYRWRDIGGILRSFILYSRTKEAGGCCRWQHLVKGRKGGREERRRFFGDFETKRESGTRRGGKGKREKEVSWRGREEKARRRRGYRRLQTLHGSPPSHNNTTPSPLAATQLLPPPRFFLLSTPSPLLVSTLVSTNLTPTPVPPSFLRLRGLRLTTRTLSKVKLTSFYFFLPPRHPSRVSPTYPHRIFSPPPLFPPPFFSLQPFLLLFLFRFSFRVPVFISLSLSLSLSFLSPRNLRRRGRDRGRCRAYQTSALGRHRGNK